MAVKESKTRITISMDKTLYEKVKNQAEKEMRSTSSLISYVINDYLNKLEDK
ncbi:ribbon-helix-helix domain-containing protein [Clostridium baratii]|uniref:ribbon-helix-helix domain-containing protein n=1 Tax=Clostridium baratii TaxID=1561 RepID=UPI0030CAB4F8